MGEGENSSSELLSFMCMFFSPTEVQRSCHALLKSAP